MSPDFDYTQFPYTFAHCLNSECLRAEQCLRRQVTLRMPKERGLVTVVNPNHVSPSGEDCNYLFSTSRNNMHEELLICSTEFRTMMQFLSNNK